MSPKEPHLS